MSLESNNASRAPVVEASVAERILNDAPDDLDLGLDETPAQKAKKPAPVEWDADEDEDAEPEDKPTKPAKPKPKPKADEPEEEDEEPAAKPRTAAVPKDDEDEPARAALPKDKGTQDKPWTVKDLPEDGFIQLKIDGKPTTVSLKEAVSGYIRTESYQAALGRMNNAEADAQQIARESLEERAAIRKYLKDIFVPPARAGDPWPLYDRLMQDPEAAIALGQRIAQQWQQWEANPGSLQEHKLMLKERAIEERERRIAERREQEEQQANMTRQQREAVERWRPVHEEALKENGFPKLTPDFQQTFKALFQAKWEATQGKVTPEMYKALFKKALALEGAESTVADRKPAPQNDPPRAARTEREPARNGKKDWASMPLNTRIRDRDFLL